MTEYVTVAYSRISELDGRTIYGTCTFPYSRNGYRSFFGMEEQRLLTFEDIVRTVKDPDKHHATHDRNDKGLGFLIACVGACLGNYHVCSETNQSVKNTSDIIKHIINNDDVQHILNYRSE